MAVPKKRTSSARRDSRRAQHDKLAAQNIISCPNCGAPKLSHHVCGECGWYKGRTVIQFVSADAPSGDAAAESSAAE